MAACDYEMGTRPLGHLDVEALPDTKSRPGPITDVVKSIAPASHENGSFDEPMRTIINTKMREMDLNPPMNQTLSVQVSPVGMTRDNSKSFYVYKPLETPSTIRLLRIKRKRGHGIESGQLAFQYSVVHTSLERIPSYETLSYVWGTKERNATIELQDKTLLRITKTLERALPFITRHCETEYLWIDQICINQDNLKERAHQVLLMGRIYSECWCVIAWVFSHVESGSTETTAQQTEIKPNQQIPAQSDEDWRYLLRNKKVYDMLLGIYEAFCSSPYTGRAWVLQELVLPLRSKIIACLHNAPQCYCSSLSLASLHQVSRLLYERDALPISSKIMSFSITHRQTLEFIDCLWSQKHGHLQWTLSLDEILGHFTSSAKTSEDLDRLYAFYGLNPEPSIILRPSYGIEFEDALISFTRSVLWGRKRLDIFENASRRGSQANMAGGKASRQLPSWVPDFRIDPGFAPFDTVSRESRFGKFNDMMYPWQGPCDSSTLHTRGRLIDFFATEISIPVFEKRKDTFLEDIFHSFVACERAWEEVNSLPRPQSPQGQDSINDYVGAPRTSLFNLVWALLSDLTCHSLKYTDPITLGSFLHQLRQMPPFSLESEDIEENSVFRKLKEHVWKDISSAMSGRALWMTQSGRLAICNRINVKGGPVEAGDAICILHGYDNPIVLRPCTDGKYKLVGLCCLDEWMNAFSTGKVFWKEDEGDEFIIV